MDKILLSGIRLEVNLGVPAEERSLPQTVVVDAEFEFDCREAARDDDFTRTIDYSAVHATLRQAATSRPYALVETMAEAMAAAVLAGFEVESVRILIRKPKALSAEGVDWAGVEIVRRKGG